MTPMTDIFDFNKNMEQFSKYMPDFANSAPLKAMNDLSAKYREVAIEAMNRNIELTTAWMKDAARDATTLLATDTQPTAYAKKAAELGAAAMQDIPARLFAYAEVAKKAQTQLFDTVVSMTPRVVEDAAEEAADRAKAVAKTKKVA